MMLFGNRQVSCFARIQAQTEGGAAAAAPTIIIPDNITTADAAIAELAAQVIPNSKPKKLSEGDPKLA